MSEYMISYYQEDPGNIYSSFYVMKNPPNFPNPPSLFYICRICYTFRVTCCCTKGFNRIVSDII